MGALGTIGSLACLSMAGALYQLAASAADEATLLPPGQLVDIGGYRLHLDCTGPTIPGQPTVILESGGGMASPSWGWVQPTIADATRVCAYDRAGYGWSDAGPLPRDARTIADELHTLLGAAGIAGPLVLAGHSIGGIYVRVYESLYPGDVAGIVLIDASHPDQLERSSAIRAEQDGSWTMLRLAPLLATLGVVRMTGMLNSTIEGLPAQQHKEMSRFLATAGQLETVIAELSSWKASAADARATTFPSEVPVAVLTATTDSLEGMPELQAELAKLSRRSTHIVADGASHTSLLSNEIHAAQTAAVILEVVATAAAD